MNFFAVYDSSVLICGDRSDSSQTPGSDDDFTVLLSFLASLGGRQE